MGRRLELAGPRGGEGIGSSVRVRRALAPTDGRRPAVAGRGTAESRRGRDDGTTVQIRMDGPGHSRAGRRADVRRPTVGVAMSVNVKGDTPRSDSRVGSGPETFPRRGHRHTRSLPLAVWPISEFKIGRCEDVVVVGLTKPTFDFKIGRIETKPRARGKLVGLLMFSTGS